MPHKSNGIVQWCALIYWCLSPVTTGRGSSSSDEDLMLIKRKCLDLCLFKLFLRVMNETKMNRCEIDGNHSQNVSLLTLRICRTV